MPGIYDKTIDRKQFLISAIGAVGAVTLSPAVRAQTVSEKSLRVAVLSDTHTPADETNEYRGFFPQRNLKAIVPQVADSNCECAIINGDAARLTGELADYEVLKDSLKPVAEKMPIFIGLGNHDHRGNFHQVLGKTPESNRGVSGKHTLVIESEVVQIVVLDSLFYVDEVAGLLGKAQRTWLAEFLKTADDRPIVIFVHHTLGDGDGELLDVDRLFDIIKPYRQVQAIFYGHSHRYHIHERNGVKLVNLPAIGYNFNDKEPVGWIDANFTTTGVAMKLNAIAGNLEGNGKTTTLHWV